LSLRFMMFLRWFQRVARLSVAGGTCMSGSVLTTAVSEGTSGDPSSAKEELEAAEGLLALSGEEAPEVLLLDCAGEPTAKAMARASEPLAMATSRAARVWWIQYRSC